MYNELLISIFQTINDFIRIPDTFQTDIITSVIALFVVIDPIGNIPLFIAFTKKLQKAEHKRYLKLLYLQRQRYYFFSGWQEHRFCNYLE
jgi:hypothetical protein